MTDQAELSVKLFDASGEDRDVELHPAMVRELEAHQLLWIDLDGRGRDEIERIRAALDLPAETSRLLSETEASARLLLYPGRVHARLVAMQPADGEDPGRGRSTALETAPIDIIIGPNVVVTVHHGSIRAFEEFERNVRGDSHLGSLDAAGFLSVLVDSVLSVYLELVEGIERRIDALDELALRSDKTSSFLEEVIALRRRVALLRRVLAPHRVAFAPLARPDLEVEDLGRPWVGVLDRLDRAIAAVENARELLIGSFDVYMARTAQRANDVMKALTILSAILLPAVVLAGVMGMNFKIPFFEEPANFWLAIVAMLTLAVGVLGISRWRGWI